MQLLLFVLSIVIPVKISNRLTKNLDSGILRVIIACIFVAVSFIICNAFSQHVGFIQSAINTYHFLKNMIIVVILGILAIVYWVFIS